jgi:hypothetical protein
MHTHRFRAALAAVAILLPLRATAAIPPGAEAPLPTPAYVVVDRILAEYEHLSLDSLQVVQLTRLAERLRADRGRIKLVRRNGVPGKAVPRYTRVRVFPTSDEALRHALDLLTPEQRSEAARLLRASMATGSRRDGGGK